MNHEELVRIVSCTISGVKLLGLESSLTHYHLSTVIDSIPVLFSSLNTTLKSQSFCLIPNKAGNEDIEQDSSGLWFTTPERTICDMIIYDRREDLIIEALDDYLSEPERFKGKDYLLTIARKYKVESQVLAYIDEIDDYFTY